MFWRIIFPLLRPEGPLGLADRLRDKSFQDLLGMNRDFRPKFARPFLDGERCVLKALASFDQAVKAGTFPALEESYS